MCGIVGAFGNLSYKEKNAVKWLLHLDVLRGGHSTGVAAIKATATDFNVKVFKELGVPEKLYNTYPEEFKDGVYDDILTDGLIGHNRYATLGEITVENAHPFQFEHVTGAHNGTVNMWSIKDLHGGSEYKVDSQIIFSQLNEDPNLQNIWDTADGAMALSWFDKRDGLLHLARNGERPLNYCMSKDGYNVFWASEGWMLSTVLSRLGLPHTDVISIQANTHIAFSGEEFKLEKFQQELTPFQKKIVPYEYKKPAQNWNEEVETLQIVEFCHDGPSEYEGYFVGLTEDKTEIIIPIYQYLGKQDHDSIMKNLNTYRPFYSYNPRHVYTQNNYPTLPFLRLTHLPKLIDHVARRKAEQNKNLEDKKEVQWSAVDFYGKPLTRKQWHQMYTRGETECAICKKRVDRHGANSVLWLSPEELACSDCKDESWVQDWFFKENYRYTM